MSDDALEFASKHYKHPKIHFEKKNFNTDSFKKNYYDVCVSMEVIEHLKNYQFHLKQISSALKKGGLLFLTTPNASLSKGLNEYHIKEFKYDEIQKLLNDNGLKIVQSIGLSENITSRIAGRLTPKRLIPIIKSIPLYSLIIKLFFKPTRGAGDNSENIFVICKKE